MKKQMSTVPCEGEASTNPLSELEKHLLEKKREILEEPVSSRAKILIGSKDHAADFYATASLDFIRSMDIQLRDRKQEIVRHIDGALDRIRLGCYGDCRECGEKISKARLKALPMTELCVRCKETEEKTAVTPHHRCGCPFPHSSVVWDVAFALRGQP